MTYTPQKWIDFHIHTFPDKLFKAIRTWFVNNPGWRFPFEGGSGDIVRYLEGMEGLEKYLCFGYAHKPGIAQDLNDFYLEIMKASPKALALGAVHQDDDNIAGIAHRGFDRGLAGFKLHCQVQKVDPADKRLWPLYEACIERNKLVLLHAGNGPFDGEFVGFSRFIPLMRRFPRLKCVVAHLGCFEPSEFMAATDDYEGLYLDTAYTFIPTPSNLMDAPLELMRRHHKKILFATDFPGICHGYEAGVRAIADLPLPKEELDAIFYGNAARFLGEE